MASTPSDARNGIKTSELHGQTGRKVLTSWNRRPEEWQAQPASWWSCAASETSPGLRLLWRRHRLWSVSQRPDLNTKRKKTTTTTTHSLLIISYLEKATPGPFSTTNLAKSAPLRSTFSINKGAAFLGVRKEPKCPL